MDKKKKGLILSVIGLLGLIVITVGVTYAFFNYVKEGTTENTVTTGTITFLYTEIDKAGAGISIENAFPMDDTTGKAQTGAKNVFNFKVEANNSGKSAISYEVTARKSSDSTLVEEAVKLYLTEVTVNGEKELLLDNYSNLTPTSVEVPTGTVEKTIYTGKVASNTMDYKKEFRLRMWIDNEMNFSPTKDENGQDVYPYNDKTFTVTVNVYANAKVVTQDEIEQESVAEIVSIQTEDGTTFDEVTGKAYDYEASLPEGTTETTINIETNSPNASVNIQKLDSLEQVDNNKTYNVQRLSATKTLKLTEGVNYFKVTVTSVNEEVENEFILKIKVGAEKVTIFNKTFIVEDEEPNLKSTSAEANESGLYKSTATNFNGEKGKPTYYFRGAVENNYIDFAGFTWRVVRVNEDGTIRIVMQDGINNNAAYGYSSSMYYSKSGVKTHLETWYDTNIIKTNLSDKVATGDYFCEQAKIAASASLASSSGIGMIVYTEYTNPTFECNNDNNGYGIVNASVGLLNYDEVVHAGGNGYKASSTYYLHKSTYYWWTMSPAGPGYVWRGHTNAALAHASLGDSVHRLRAVINLKPTVAVTGSGTSDDHWVVQ